jgi:hypothetical protein
MTNCKRKGCSKPAKKVYCSISCAAVVNNSLYKKKIRRDPGHYHCAYCNTKHERRSNTMNKYCDNVCQQKHRKHIRNEKIERDEHMGKAVGKKRQIISYLKDTNQWHCNQCGATEEEAPMGTDTTIVCQTRWCYAVIVMGEHKTSRLKIKDVATIYSYI